MRWRVVGNPPDAPKYIIIGAPHTSNWDGIFLIAMAWALRVPVRWLGKNSLFRPPYGWFMRWMGGISIDRSKSNNTVDLICERFAEEKVFVLAVPAEGTRRRREYWKSGFYHIASQAEVPILLSFLDYAKKEGGFGPSVTPSGDVSADMNEIREFYTGISGKYPEKFTPPRLRSEDTAGDQSPSEPAG